MYIGVWPDLVLISGCRISSRIQNIRPDNPTLIILIYTIYIVSFLPGAVSSGVAEQVVVHGRFPPVASARVLVKPLFPLAKENHVYFD